MQLNKKQKDALFATLDNRGYSCLKLLGKGGDGEVFLMKEKNSSKEYAVKCFPNSSEFNRLKKLSKCNHVVAPYFYVEVKSDLFAYFMEKCSEIQTSFPSKKLLLGILEGIRELDEKGFEQIDGFEGNILLKKGAEVVISDFSSFAAKNQNSVRNQIEKMLEYVSSKRNIKKLISSIKQNNIKYDIPSIKKFISESEEIT